MLVRPRHRARLSVQVKVVPEIQPVSWHPDHRSQKPTRQKLSKDEKEISRRLLLFPSDLAVAERVQRIQAAIRPKKSSNFHYKTRSHVPGKRNLPDTVVRRSGPRRTLHCAEIHPKSLLNRRPQIRPPHLRPALRCQPSPCIRLQ